MKEMFKVEKTDDGLYITEQDGSRVAQMLGQPSAEQAELAEMFAAMPEVVKMAAALQFLNDLMDQQHRRVVVGSRPPTVIGGKPKPIVGFQWTFVSTHSADFKAAVLAAYEKFQQMQLDPQTSEAPNVREIYPGPKKAILNDPDHG